MLLEIKKGIEMFLNKKSRTAYLMISACVAYIDYWLMDDKHQLDGESLKYIRTARTYFNKAGVKLVEKLDNDYRNRLLTDVKNHEVKLEQRKSVPQSDIIHVNQEDVYDLADHALVICQGGKWCTKNYKKCSAYKALMNLRIPVAELNPPKGKCPYMLEVKQ